MAQIVKEWLMERETSFLHMYYLPQYLKFNPVKNLWDVPRYTFSSVSLLKQDLDFMSINLDF